MEKPKDFPDNLILIGMFGSGKTTIGRILADLLRYHFLDVDHLVESKYKKPLQKVLEALGMEGFMKMEEETLLSLQARHCVISTGSSSVYYPKAMEHLKTLGPRVYLKVPLAELKRRLPEWTSRSVVRRGGNDLPSLFKERSPLLNRYADFSIPAFGRPWERLALDILEHYGVKVPPEKPGKPGENVDQGK
jgi:shikimate kinase